MIEKIATDYCPSKIVCVGRNYIDHAKELGNEVPTAPLLFLKAPSSYVADGEAIVLPEQSSQVEHEAELGIVIAKQCKGLADDADITEYIKGFTCVNDVTARDVQRNDVQFTRGKSFDTFCPIGPHIVAGLDVTDISIVCRVNGDIRQSGRTSQMVFSPSYLIRYISRQMTLMPGDVIATGTPAGVSKLSAGDVCEVEIEGIGILSNPIIAAKD
ncbi:MAG TPA: fumarylacetoacetate hydrolase family protein [Pyrinomonadaceae bacterium]|nr:fumarylacetoacetate hydrolase family protein [Pyrinomonadaceae bacterium]